MGSCFGSELFRIIFIIIFCLLLLLQRTHIFTAEAKAGYFHIHGLQQTYFKENNIGENENQLRRISGLDENEEKEALIVEKFRTLLGLKSFYHRRHFNGYSEHVFSSPSPSPSIPRAPAPAPAPAPALHVHHHHRHPRHPSHWDLTSHNIGDEHRGRAKRILVAVLVSVGVAAVTLICAIGLISVCRKFRNHRKRAKRTMPLYGKKKGKNQKSSSNVSLNSGLDLLYLDSLSEDMEQHTCTLKQTAGVVDATLSHCISTPLYEREEIKKDLITPELNNSSSCSTKEILSVQEDVESMKYESDDGDKVIIPMEDDSSDNESFHSIVDSHSSNVRLSNASAVSLSESTSSLSPKALQPNTSSMADSTDTTPITLISSVPCSSGNSISKQQEEKIETCVKHPQTFMPPPPPPVPTSQMPLFQLHSLYSSSGIASQSPRSPTLDNLSSARYSDSNSNQTGEIESPSPSQPSPSKSPSSIPPPPCLPPFKVNSNNGKNPPPPPSQLPQFTPIGKDGAPLPKLKPLHWDKVRAAPDRSMVWDKLRSSSFELDEEMMESLFGYNLQNSMKNEETKSKTPSPSKHVLEPKRLQNITILSKALNVTAEQVCEALIQGKGLSLQQLEALVKMVPTKEEEAKLSSYKGDINELGSAEKLVKAMLGVPFAFQRVEAMLYKETFEDEVFHLRNSFSMLEEACKELRSSRLFLKLLEAVLKTGNRMNVGTIRGGAIAFKLDTLLKLADVKGTDGKTTLLHFVVQEIVRSEGIKVSDSIMGKISLKSKNRTEEEKEEDYVRMGLELVSGLSTELYNVKKTATIDLDVLASSVSNLSDGMAKLRHLVQKELSSDENSENFVNSMKSFLNYAERNLVELQGDEDGVFTRVKEITEYFHGDVSKEDANPLRIFVIVRDFLGMLDNVCRELRRSKVPRTPNPLAPFR